MKSAGVKGHTAIIIGLAVFFLIGDGCATSNKATVDDRTKKQDLIPLPYPHAGMGVGTLRWGRDPEQPAATYLPANQAFSKAFLERIPANAVAWENESKKRDWVAAVAAKPGPQLLEAIAPATLSAEAKLNLESCRFIKWGSLKESAIDIQSLSEAYLRGWFNMPGRALGAEALSKVRLDLDHDQMPDRPWVVIRSVAASGLQYGLTKELGAMLSAGGGLAPYGDASGSINFKLSGANTLEVTSPMVIGYDVAMLERVTPRLPLPGAGGDLAGHYEFTWHIRASGEHKVVAVEEKLLKEQDRRLSVENALPPAVVTDLSAQLERAEPARVALVCEAKPHFPVRPDENKWRRLCEGGNFLSNELLRLRVLLDEPAFVYILAKDSQGQAAMVYPTVPGETLSRGEDKLLSKGELAYPQDFTREEGLTYNPGDPSGIESFVVIATRTKSEGLAAAMAAFAKAARERAAKSTPSRDAVLAFSSLTRIPAGFGSSIAAPQNTSGPLTPVSSGEETFFTGLKSATVLTLNLHRQAIPVSK